MVETASATHEAALAAATVAGQARSRPLVVYLALFAGMLGISFTAIFTKWAAMPGPVTAAYRMIFAAGILLGPFAWRRLKSRSGRSRQARAVPGAALRMRRAVAFAGAGGLWFGLNLAFLNSALMLTSAATATLLDNTAPIWVGIGAMFLFRERLRARYWLGLFLALAGAGVVSGIGPALASVRGAGVAQALNPGAVLAFVGASFYAAYLLTTQRARRDLDTVSYLWLIEASAAVTLLFVALVLRLPLVGYSTRSYLAIFAMAVVSQTCGWLLISYALGYLPASTAGILLLGQPIVTSLLAIPLLGERLQVAQIAGGALVLVGIYLCVRQNDADG